MERRYDAAILRKSFFKQDQEASYGLAGEDDTAGVVVYLPQPSPGTNRKRGQARMALV